MLATDFGVLLLLPRRLAFVHSVSWRVPGEKLDQLEKNRSGGITSIRLTVKGTVEEVELRLYYLIRS